GCCGWSGGCGRLGRAHPRGEGDRLHGRKRRRVAAGRDVDDGRRAVAAGDEEPLRTAAPGEPGDLGGLQQFHNAPERVHVEERGGRPLVARVAIVCSLLARHDQASATRVRYLPSRVSIFRTSPSLMNSGTLTTYPVSSSAGFVAPLTVSPRTPGSHLTTLRSTELGSDSPMGLPL